MIINNNIKTSLENLEKINRENKFFTESKESKEKTNEKKHLLGKSSSPKNKNKSISKHSGNVSSEKNTVLAEKKYQQENKQTNSRRLEDIFTRYDDRLYNCT